MKKEFINIVQNELTQHEQHLAWKASRNLYKKEFSQLDAGQMASVLCKVSEYVELDK